MIELSELIQARFRLDFNANKKSKTEQSFCLDVDFNMPGTGITAIFGHSGSGKTSLLRCIAGLEKTSSGYLIVNNETWQDETHFLPTHKRPLAYVFQEASLFEHLTVQGNLDFAIKRSGLLHKGSGLFQEKETSNTELYKQVIDVMGIENLLTQIPDGLSGGERQRAAIARALLIKPRLLLMDEPLASLDDARKQEILHYLEAIRNTFDIPIIYVSHSLDEVARLADHVVLLEQGAIVAQGNVQAVFSRLDLPMHFGQDWSVVVHGTVSMIDQQWHIATVSIDSGEIQIPDNQFIVGQEMRVRILAKDISLALEPQTDNSILNKLAARVLEVSNDPNSAMALVRLQIGKNTLIARLTRKSVHQLNLRADSEVWAQIKSVAVVA